MPHSRTRLMVQALSVVIAVLVVGLIFAKRLWVHQNVNEPLQRRLAAMTAELKAKGSQVGEPRLAAGVSGVEQILVLDVDGQSIRLLEFDPSNAAEAKELKHVHDDHKTSVLGTEQRAEDETDIVIIDFENHPREKEILEAFHKSLVGP